MISPVGDIMLYVEVRTTNNHLIPCKRRAIYILEPRSLLVYLSALIIVTIHSFRSHSVVLLKHTVTAICRRFLLSASKLIIRMMVKNGTAAALPQYLILWNYIQNHPCHINSEAGNVTTEIPIRYSSPPEYPNPNSKP